MSKQTGVASSLYYSECLALIGLESGIDSKDSNYEILRSYNYLVKSVVNVIKLARKEIYLASTYYEPVVGSKLVQKFSEGVSLNILDGNPSGTTFVERIKEAARLPTKDREILNKLLQSPKVRIRNAPVRYSFIVVDRLYSEFEIVDTTNPSLFNLAVKTDEPKVADKLIGVFKETAQAQESSESTQSRSS